MLVRPLSIEEIIACSNSPKYLGEGGGGCAGGYFYDTFEYVINVGAGREEFYPYNEQSYNSGNIQCNTNLTNSRLYTGSRLRIRDRGFINTGDCYSLVMQLTTHALAVTISTRDFQFYMRGTYDNEGLEPNHGVTLVGYDPVLGYKLKKSWGETWGMIGFAYVSETTGICNYSMFPITGYERAMLRKPC
jgi:hypothetical protein